MDDQKERKTIFGGEGGSINIIIFALKAVAIIGLITGICLGIYFIR